VEHRIVLPGTTGPEVVIRTSLIGFPEVSVGGEAIEQGSVRGRPAWPIPLEDGSTKLLFIRGAMTGLQGAVDGQLIRIERRLTNWELLLCLAPFSLVVFGLLGGLIGFAASVLDLRLVRRPATAMGRLGILVASFAVALALTYLAVGVLSR
jgi:hypothetical protein